MKPDSKIRFRLLAAVAALLMAPPSFAASIIIPTIAVVKGDTAEIPLEFEAGDGVTNFDFVMDYNPDVVDETTLDVVCSPGAVDLASLECVIDTDKNQVRGIGVNETLTPLTSGIFAVISLPVFADAPSGESASSFSANFSSGITATPELTSWTPKVNDSYCNWVNLSGAALTPAELHEACEVLVVESDFTALDGSSVFLSAGWQIEFTPGALIETGATVDAEVCGQSLCEASLEPMPAECHSCVIQICNEDSSCCDTAFTQSCVDMVNTVCGLVCDPNPSP